MLYIIRLFLVRFRHDSGAREISGIRFSMLVGQIKPQHIYYDNPGLIVIGGLSRQPVRVRENFIQTMGSKKKQCSITQGKRCGKHASKTVNNKLIMGSGREEVSSRMCMVM